MRQIALGILATFMFASPAPAQELVRTRLVSTTALGGVTFTKPALAPLAVQAAPPPSLPATPTVSVSAAIDFPSLYIFRGIRYGDPSFETQPYIELDANAGSASFAVGSWNSVNWDSIPGVHGRWYESDAYASVGFTAGKVRPAVHYTAYTSPNDDFGTVQELAFSADVDDSASSVPLSPSVLVAFELGDNSADGGANKGIYLQLRIKPSIPTGNDSKVSLSVPVTLGMSLKNYYEGPHGDSTFGYFSVGLTASVDMGGGVDLHEDVLVYGFGDTLKAFNNNKASEVVGSVGIGVGF